MSLCPGLAHAVALIARSPAVCSHCVLSRNMTQHLDLCTCIRKSFVMQDHSCSAWGGEDFFLQIREPVVLRMATCELAMVPSANRFPCIASFRHRTRLHPKAFLPARLPLTRK